MSTDPFTDRFDVGSDGANVIAHVAGAPLGTRPVVVAAHGLTASSASWARLAKRLDRAVTFVALDLRGRGLSNRHPGSYGMAAHARDCIAVLDQHHIDRGVLIGHSMGAYVMARAAREQPQRLLGLVLVDGGLRVEKPSNMAPDAVEAVVGPAISRLSMSWASRDDAVEFWKNHPSFDPWCCWHERFVDADLVSTDDGRLRSRVDEQAVRFDGAELFTDPRAGLAASETAVATWLLRAPRGMLNDASAPLLSDAAVDALRSDRPDVEIIDADAHVNHYSIMWDDGAVDMLAQAVLAACTG